MGSSSARRTVRNICTVRCPAPFQSDDDAPDDTAPILLDCYKLPSSMMPSMTIRSPRFR